MSNIEKMAQVIDERDLNGKAFPYFILMQTMLVDVGGKVSGVSDCRCMTILQKIRNHPNQDRAHAVVRDLIARISAGERLESIEAQYHEDLELMRKGA